MSPNYLRPAELFDGLRLHQNENTGGCSPKVVEALANMPRDRVGFYPAYKAMEAAAAKYFGVDQDHLVLTNGLDEGIMALSVACLRPKPGGPVPEAVIPEPTFEIYNVDTDVAGGREVTVPPAPDFAFPLDAVLAAITPATRVAFLTNPNNPTGQMLSKADVKAVAKAVPPEAIVFLDEAYAEFAGETFIPELPQFPNVIVGRTFSKAFGLAGLRVGALIGDPDRLAPIVRAIPVYSVSVAAATALPAALEDGAYLDDYLRQVKESKALLYKACDTLGLTYWKSGGNFVLVRIGDRSKDVIAALAAKKIYIRDRSNDAGCAGCVRIATGQVAHTQQLIAALEEVLCAAR
ncbi:MAG: histidinol-phosphate aminotransferase family protein [Acidobacteriota bacterium]|nr:histidinol-phosphate aminotransferase family protein [Acidobacteriota bacterium]